MNKITGNEPAMPMTAEATQSIHTGFGYSGLTIRQEFASRAMQGLCANSIPGEQHMPANLAKEAVEYADALIIALNGE